MKKLTQLSVSALFFISLNAFADPHLDEAISHATAALESGKSGHSSVLVEHARPALEHAMAASVTTKGLARTKIEAAMKDLEEAIKHGKSLHADIATTYMEAALEDLQAANSK